MIVGRAFVRTADRQPVIVMPGRRSLGPSRAAGASLATSDQWSHPAGEHRRADTTSWTSRGRSPTCIWAGPAFGRSPATVNRELRRNGTAPTSRRPGKYAPDAAQKQAELRDGWPKSSKFDYVELADVLQSELCVKGSPEQVSHHLTERFPERAEMRVCPDTIYMALYVQDRASERWTCTDTCVPVVRSGA